MSGVNDTSANASANDAPTNDSASLRWVVYILRCDDGSLYTGITTSLDRRVHEHNHSPKGARYTRARRPVVLVYCEHHPSRAEASRREAAIKKLERHAKERLVQAHLNA